MKKALRKYVSRLSRFYNWFVGYRTPLVVSKEENKENMRAIARHNCHSGLDPESYKRWTLTSNVGKILNQVQDDKMDNIRALARIKALFTYCPIALLPSRTAFTMAEILLSLTIIGVVAAITLPSLTGNINERTWNTQRKALYARMSQAISLMPALNGYGTYQLADPANSVNAEDTATETFVTDGLSKVMKINNICDNEHLEDCGIVTSYTNIAGTTKIMPTKLSELNSAFTESVSYNDIIVGINPQHTIDTKAAAFETANGESIVVFYNPNCISPINISTVLNTSEFTQTFMCANFIYDLNGNKGPNTVGKDMGFMSVLYPSDSSVVAPNPTIRNVNNSAQMNFNNARSVCNSKDNESRLPNIEELASMFYNRDLIGIYAINVWSSSFTSADLGWYLRFSTGERINTDFERSSCAVRCIKR